MGILVIIVLVVVIFAAFGSFSSGTASVPTPPLQPEKKPCASCGQQFKTYNLYDQKVDGEKPVFLCCDCQETKAVCFNCGACAPKSKCSMVPIDHRYDMNFARFCVSCMRKKYHPFREVNWSELIFATTEDVTLKNIPKRPGILVVWGRSGSVLGFPSYEVVMADEAANLHALINLYASIAERNYKEGSVIEKSLQYALLDEADERQGAVRWLTNRYSRCKSAIPNKGKVIAINDPPRE